MLTLIKKVLWDYWLTDEEIMSIYQGNLVIGGMNDVKLKARLLNSYNWYTLVKELGFTNAKELLKPEVIGNLYPKSLQESYKYAARVLQ
jgi:hypothetical protein